MLMFVQGVPPIAAERITYYSDPVFAGRFDKNPYV
jgi:type IV secretory pathway TraG/TraD family ATPase VirD4